METNNYLCSFCGKRDVKLWRPYNENAPLVCAQCAEERQIQMGCCKTVEAYRGKTLFGPKWRVDEKGQIPFCTACGGNASQESKTNVLVIRLADADFTELVPALPDGNGGFHDYGKKPERKEISDWWKKLPTR